MTDVHIYGVHAVRALLQNSKRKIKSLWLQEDKATRAFAPLFEQAQTLNIPIHLVPSNILTQKFKKVVHQGIIAVAAELPRYTDADLPMLLKELDTPPLILILDGITDPHNLGACLRTADATGVSFIMLPKDKSASPTPTVSKIASGALESVPIVQVTNLARAIEFLKKQGIWIFGAAGEVGATLWSLDCKGPTAIVLGAEGSGLRRLTREHCDILFSLPMLGCVESLNVSVAAGVCLYETVRQRELSTGSLF